MEEFVSLVPKSFLMLLSENNNNNNKLSLVNITAWLLAVNLLKHFEELFHYFLMNGLQGPRDESNEEILGARRWGKLL